MSRKALLLPAALIAAAAWYLVHRATEDRVVSGTLEADEVRVGSRAGGRLSRLLAEEGAALTNGQVIAELAAPELEARRREAAAQLAQMVAGPRTQEIAAAAAEVAALEAEFAYAELEAQRKVALEKERTSSASERDAAVGRVAVLQKQAAAARERHALLAAGARPEEIERARAQLAEVESRLVECTIRAPAPTVLEVLHARPGDVVPPNGAVATLIFQQPPWLRVYVPELLLPRLQVGQSLPLRVDGFAGRAFTGDIVQINRKAEFTPRNVQTAGERVKQVFGVKLRVRDPDGVLHPGMGAEVVVGKKNGVLE